MDGAVLIVFVLLASLVLLDLAALRFGVDSRCSDGPRGDDRPDWW